MDHKQAFTSELDVKIEEMDIVVERLKESLGPLEPKQERLLAECERWLEVAQRSWKRIPPWKRFSALDSSYAALHYVRHLLCELLPLDQLYPVRLDIELNLSYVRDEKRRAALKEDLDGISVQIETLVEEDNTEDKAGVRRKLVCNSIWVAHEREAIWHKINLIRIRLFITLLVLMVLLAAAVWLVPCVVVQVSGADITWCQVVAMAVLGALGGALSAMMTREPLQLHIPQYYLKQTLLYLRPAVGAAAGLSLGLFQLSGVVSILTDSSDGINWTVVLLVSFLGGFSERFFLGQMDTLVGEKQETGAPAT